MIVNNEQQAQGAPIKPPVSTEPQNNQPPRPEGEFNPKLTYSWLHSLSEENGSKLTEEDILRYSKENVADNFLDIYAKVGAPLPEPTVLDSIYESFFEIPEVETVPPVEKKKSTESPSILEPEESSSESSVDSETRPPVVAIEGGKDRTTRRKLVENDNNIFQESKNFEDYITASDASWFNMNERDAEVQFNSQFGMMGFRANQSEPNSNVLEVVAPNGKTKRVRLYTDAYKAVSGEVGDADWRENFHKTDLNNWMKSNLVQTPFADSDLRSGNSAIIKKTVDDYMSSSVAFAGEDVEFLKSVLGREFQATQDNDKRGVFKPNLTIFHIHNQIGISKQKITDLQSQIQEITPDNPVYYPNRPSGTFQNRAGSSDPDEFDKLNSILSAEKAKLKRLQKLEDQAVFAKTSMSSTLGSKLLQSGAYEMYDFANNDKEIRRFEALGMDMGDLPLNQLRVNGRPSTYNEMSRLLTDYEAIRDVRDGSLRLEITKDGVTGEIASNLIGQLQELEVQNKAMRSDGLFGNDGFWSHYFENTLDETANVFQELGIATLEAVGDIGRAGKDFMKMIFGDEIYDNVRPNSGLGNYSQIQGLRKKYLPMYDSTLSDAGSFGEAMAKGSNTLAHSLPVMATFAVHPTLGLGVVGTSSYGREIGEIEREIQRAKESLSEDDFLFEEDRLRAKQTAEMSKLEMRGYALLVAGGETALTRAFTFNYFKSARAARNFKGTVNETNAKKLSDQFTKYSRMSWLDKTAHQLGINRRALAAEVMEEDLIATNRYLVRVGMGLEEFDAKKYSDLIRETSLNSAFSSVGMAKMASMYQTPRLQKATNEYIMKNILIDGELEAAHRLIRAEESLQQELNPRVRPIEYIPEENRTLIGEEGQSGVRIQQKGQVTNAESKVNQDNVDMLNEVINDARQTLENARASKKQLLDEMTDKDKEEFLFQMQAIEKAQRSIYDTENRSVALTAYKNIAAAKDKARQVLLKYPSQLTFDYLPANLQTKYLERAKNAIIQDEFNGNENATYAIRTYDPFSFLEEEQDNSQEYDIDPAKIRKLAGEMYVNEVKEVGLTTYLGMHVLPGFDYVNTDRMVPDRTPNKDKVYDLRGRLNKIYGLDNQGVLNFDKPVETKRKSDELEAQEILDFTKGQVPVAEGTQESDVVLEPEIDAKIDNKEVVEQRNMETGRQVKDAVSESARQSAKNRIDMVLQRLDEYDMEIDVFAELNANQRKDLEQFFDDLESSKRGNIGKVETILDALDIAMEIRSQSNSIDLSNTETHSSLLKAYTDINASWYLHGSPFAQVVFTESSMASTTLLMRNMFPDAQTAQAFVNLNMEAGRITDAVKNDVSKKKSEQVSLYEQDALNDADYTSANKKNRKNLADPNSLENSYELYALSMLYRLQGETNKDGVDIEFARTKKLILDELALRKNEYETTTDKKQREANFVKYKLWEGMVDKLGIKDATAYEYVAARASGRNKNMIDRLASLQPTDKALDRIQDFNRFNPTVMQRYLPTFYTHGTQKSGYADAFGFSTESEGGIIGANQAKDVVLPTELGGVNNLRLNPGDFFNQAFGSLQGLELDIQGRSAYRTISHLMNMPAFQLGFEGNVLMEDGTVNLTEDYQMFQDIFTKREKIFENDIRDAHKTPIDYGQEVTWKQVWGSLGSTAYTGISAVSLGRITQNTSQYYSATSAVSPMLTSPIARQHLRRNQVAFNFGLSGVMSGAQSKNALGNYLNQYFNGAYAANIFAQSSTGMRNSLASELITNQNKKFSPSYLMRAFNLVEVKEKDSDTKALPEGQKDPGTGIVKQETLPVRAPQKQLPPRSNLIDGESRPMPPTEEQVREASMRPSEQEIKTQLELAGVKFDAKYTAKQFFDLLTESNSSVLELLLANGDRAAANATFEALYLDKRIQDGAKYDPKNPMAFWEAENANPNKDAINYADEIISRTQTQTTSTAQSGIYSEYAGSSTRAASRVFYPFARHMMNARSDINNQLGILNSKETTQREKILARQSLRGRVAEVTAYMGVAKGSWVIMSKGLVAGTLSALGAVDEEDIERYDDVSINRFIGDKFLPIEDRDLVEIPNAGYKAARTQEEYDVMMKQMELGMSGLKMDMIDFQRQLMTYENKFNMDGNYQQNLTRDLVQDLITTMTPTPRMDIIDDVGIKAFNQGAAILGLDVEMNEFLSNDLRGANTKQGRVNAIAENLGYFSIGAEQVQKIIDAQNMYTSFQKYKAMPLSPDGSITVNYTAPTEEMREALVEASEFYYGMRVLNAIAPYGPRADINKVLNRMERQLDNYFKAVQVVDEKPMGEFDLSREARERRSVLEQD